MDKTKEQSSCCSTGKATGNETCCCTQPKSNKPISVPWIIAQIDTPVGKIPQIATRLLFQDILGTWKARWNINRMDYQVSPGLYAVGYPNQESPVLVSANYKMSFDRLRRELDGLNLWILVLDTKGVNVWCAAGKGTFGTRELITRIVLTKLAEVVSHRRLILPQLGAPGVSAHKVSTIAGFTVLYGPVRATDIPAYLKAGMKATPAMREVRFGFWDRLVLTPIELVGTLKPALIIFGVLSVINIIFRGSLTAYHLLSKTWADFLPFLGAALVGTVLVPVFLPVIPGRALAWKGWLLGLLWAGVYLLVFLSNVNWVQIATYLLLLPPIGSFLAMNFTGSTTYTSLSGVVKEMSIVVPAQIISAGLGILFMIGGLFV